MRISTSFSDREIEWLALTLESLRARDQAALDSLADLPAARELALKFERTRKRATGEIRKRPARRLMPREKIESIRADYADGLSQADVARKHKVLASYVSKVVRGLIRRSK